MDLYLHFLSNTNNPIHKNKHYFPIYESHFRRFVGRPNFFSGNWRWWWRVESDVEAIFFGSQAQIVTLDIRPECAAFADDQISVRIGDQSDTAFLESVISEFGKPDVVFDDGSHQAVHIVATFGYLYNKTDRNGVYMVEDLHTSYWDGWGGGLKTPGTFIELCKDLIDELNGDHINGQLRPPSVSTNAPADYQPTAFTHQTRSMHFYDSVVVFEKGRAEPTTKRSLVTGDLTMPIG